MRKKSASGILESAWPYVLGFAGCSERLSSKTAGTRAPLAVLLGTKTGEERGQLKRQPHITADAEPTGHGDHGAADLTVQYP